MRVLILLSIFLTLSPSLSAQNGDLYLKDFQVPINDASLRFNDLITDDQNRLLVAYRGGILQFDGKVWDKIDTESTPYNFLSIGDSTFVLTKKNISLLQADVYNQNILQPLFENPKNNKGNDLVKYNGSYYYLINESIIKLNGKNFETDTTYISNQGYKDIFAFQKRLFAFEGNYLLEYINGTWVDLNKYVPRNSDFVFSCQNSSRVFFAYDNGDFFIFDGEELSRYSQELNEYLHDNYPVSGKILNKKLLVATVSGGVVGVNILDGKIDYTIQYHNGLPADEVQAITIDQQGGIWLAHDHGLTRALPELPLREFQYYPGIIGIPTSVQFFDDTLMVGTNAGLFYLDKIKDYEQFQKVLKRKVRVNSADINQNENDNIFESFFDNIFSGSDSTDPREKFIETELEKAKQKFKDQGFKFKTLREKLSEKEVAIRDSLKRAGSKGQKEKSSKSSYKTVRTVVNVSKLKSIKYQFQKIEGLDKKVIDIQNIEGKTYVLSADGLYWVNKQRAVKVWSKLFLTGFTFDKANNCIWLYGLEGLYKMAYNNKEPSNITIDKMSSEIARDLAVNNDLITISNQNKLLTYRIMGSDVFQLESEIQLSNPYSQNVNVYYQNNELHVLKSDGIYSLKAPYDSLILIEDHSKEAVFYLKDNKNTMWLTKNGKWDIINNDTTGEELNWLKILPSLSDIYRTNDRYIYFISDDMVLRLDAEKDFSINEVNSFIKGAYQSSKKLINGEDIKLEHENNSLKVILSTPEYLFPEGVAYQYYVKDFKDEWSEWSGDIVIDFPFIPTGNYELQIKSRTGLHDEIKLLKFKFEVLPPYWHTWWFYLLEIAFFSMLIIISQRMNKNSENTYLTNVITFLTLILFIEFLATVLENNLEGFVGDSPVYGFGLNVLLALSISPLERLMSRGFLKMNAKSKKDPSIKNH